MDDDSPRVVPAPAPPPPLALAQPPPRPPLPSARQALAVLKQERLLIRERVQASRQLSALFKEVGVYFNEQNVLEHTWTTSTLPQLDLAIAKVGWLARPPEEKVPRHLPAGVDTRFSDGRSKIRFCDGTNHTVRPACPAPLPPPTARLRIRGSGPTGLHAPAGGLVWRAREDPVDQRGLQRDEVARPAAQQGRAHERARARLPGWPLRHAEAADGQHAGRAARRPAAAPRPLTAAAALAVCRCTF